MSRAAVAPVGLWDAFFAFQAQCQIHQAKRYWTLQVEPIAGEMAMTMDEVRNRLLGMKAKAEHAQKLLWQDRLSAAAKAEIEQLARELKEELRGEFKRLSPGRSQETFTRAESTYYWPSIHEAWVAISGLRVDGRAKKAWYNPLEETGYKLGKHLS